MPRVSICIPSYKPDHFELALRSALAQTYQDVEIVISDDCPTDAIERIVEKYSAFVRYTRNPSPGVLSNLIRCVEVSEGEYIKFLFDDDLLSPFCVQYLLDALESTRHQNTRMAFSPRDFIDGANRVTHHANYFQVAGGLKTIAGPEFIRLTALGHHNYVGEFTTAMFRRADCYDESGRFRFFATDDLLLPDLAAWLDLAERGAFVAHPATLSYFRQHDNSTSNPATNPNFIYCITYHETVLRRAVTGGYLPLDQVPESCRNLANMYRYWRNAFPQLDAAIAQLEEMAAIKVAPGARVA